MNTPDKDLGDAVTDAVTSAAVAADIVARHIKPELLELASPTGEKVPVLVLASGLKAHPVKAYFEAWRTAPERREGTARLVELLSFVDHVNRFKDEDSALFAGASQTAPTLTAVLDYHRRANVPERDVAGAVASAFVAANVALALHGKEIDTDALPARFPLQLRHVPDAAPRFGRHRASYAFPMSDEWTAWAAQHGKAMSQGDFAAWLEDRIIDVADPAQAFTTAKRFAEALGVPQFASPNRLLALSRGLQVHVEERVTSRIDPTTGETTMHYEAEHQDAGGGALAIPRAFLIQIPVFRMGTIYQLPVRLKYRLGGGKVTWLYELHGALKAFDDAFRDACESAAEKTELPLFYGAPEQP